MIVGETYELTNLHEQQMFVFISEGPKGVIPKVVQYTLHNKRRNQYNLGFGDYSEGQIDDKVITGNDDRMKVMNTIALTIYRFTEKHPDRRVLVSPVDEKRSAFYHAIFNRRWKEIEPLFEVKGRTKRKWEDFEPGKRYLAFELKIKQ